MAGRRVVITGVGLVTPLGVGTRATWEGLRAGRSGVGPISRFDASGLKVRIAGEVPPLGTTAAFDAHEARRLDPFCQYALVAAHEAIVSSGLVDGVGQCAYAPERVATLVGSGVGGIQSFEANMRRGTEKGFDRVSPFFVLQFISNLAPGRISLKWGFRGPNWSPVSACASGANAVGEAFALIRSGQADAAVAGGAESALTPMGIGGFAAMRALSTRNEAPQQASRPFDASRDGFVMAEGAGLLVLEERDAALARGAPVVAELLGYGTNSDAWHETQPHPEGLGAAACMRLALADAGVAVERVGYVNAHGTSTELNDAAESRALRSVFGAHADRLAVSGTKSMLGHALGAAGGIEAAVTALSLQAQEIHPTLNFERGGPGCDLDYVPGVARRTAFEVALSNSFGFGGTNAVLVLGREAT